MRKLLNFVFVLFLFSSLFSQGYIPWSAPALLCDSTGDNRNPAFVRGEFGSFDYNVLLWDRDFGSHSEIHLKDFADPDSEIAVNPFAAGGFSQKPTGAFIEHTETILIIWQSDQFGNFDLFSIVYQNGQFSGYLQITNDPGDDINPEVSESGMVWERDSSVYYSRYSLSNSTWSAPELVDNGGCSNPTIAGYYGDHAVAYQKREGDQFKIYRRERSSSGSWGALQLLSPDGDNRLPRYCHGLPFSLIWQHQEMGDWNIMNLSEVWPNPTLFIFSLNDERHPVALEIPIVSDDIFFPPLYFAFESANPGEAPEIYINDVLYDTVSIRNISTHAGIDRHPAFSEFSFANVTTYMARARLAWESFRNGQWQIWGSEAETNLPGLGIEDPPARVGDYRLFQNYPNPFNPVTNLGFRIWDFGFVRLEVFDITGRKVATLVRKELPPGEYEVQWDGRDDAGRKVGSGVYIYRLRAGKFAQSRKMLLIR